MFPCIFYMKCVSFCTLFILNSGARVAQWVRLQDLAVHTSLSPIRRGFAPSFVNYKKGCTRLAAASDTVYQLLAQGRWFSPGTPTSSTTKTGRRDIAEILLNMALNTKNQNKIILTSDYPLSIFKSLLLWALFEHSTHCWNNNSYRFDRLCALHDIDTWILWCLCVLVCWPDQRPCKLLPSLGVHRTS